MDKIKKYKLEIIANIIFIFACLLPIYKYDSKLILVTMGFCQGFFFCMIIDRIEKIADLKEWENVFKL